MKANYLLVAKIEVLNERTHGIMADYERYILNSNSPLDCIRVLYDNLCTYSQKVILCKDEEEFLKLSENIDMFERIIKEVISNKAVA